MTVTTRLLSESPTLQAAIAAQVSNVSSNQLAQYLESLPNEDSGAIPATGPYLSGKTVMVNVPSS